MTSTKQLRSFNSKSNQVSLFAQYGSVIIDSDSDGKGNGMCLYVSFQVRWTT